MSDPKSYTDIGGGGPYPPHGEDFFDRIVNVHWPKRGPAFTGGVFIAADFQESNVFYLKIGLGASTDTNTGKPIWQNLGPLDFHQFPSDGPSTGWVNGSAYGLVRDKEPVFVLVGGGGGTNGIGLIMASHDGLNWSQVFTLTDEAPGFRGANIFGVVWDGTSFWAGGHISINYTPVTDPYLREIDILFQSADGFSWGEVGRATNVNGPVTDPDASWSLGDYTRGLLASNCSDRVVDGHNNGLPDGFYGYVPDVRMIVPTDIADIDYFFGQVRHGIGSGVIVNNFGTGTLPAPFPSDPGLPTHCVATAGGAWVAAGGTFSNAPDGFTGGTCEAAMLVPSTEPGGIAWESNSPGGRSPIITICGGQPLPSSS